MLKTWAKVAIIIEIITNFVRTNADYYEKSD